MKRVKPFEYIDPAATDIICFLAGGCTNNEWREEVYSYLDGRTLNSLVLIDPYNPNIESVFKQIQWEYMYLNDYDDCSFIFSVYFDKYTDQPVSMYELGRASVLSKQKQLDFTMGERTGAIITQYGYPCIVSVSKDAPKKEDIKIQCGLAHIECKERTPEQHALAIIQEYAYIRKQMGA